MGRQQSENHCPRGLKDSAKSLQGGLQSFGSALERFGRALESFGSALESFGSALESFGSALEPFGRAVESFGSALQPFGSALEPHSNELHCYSTDSGRMARSRGSRPLVRPLGEDHARWSRATIKMRHSWAVGAKERRCRRIGSVLQGIVKLSHHSRKMRCVCATRATAALRLCRPSSIRVADRPTGRSSRGRNEHWRRLWRTVLRLDACS